MKSPSLEISNKNLEFREVDSAADTSLAHLAAKGQEQPRHTTQMQCDQGCLMESVAVYGARCHDGGPESVKPVTTRSCIRKV